MNLYKITELVLEIITLLNSTEVYAARYKVFCTKIQLLLEKAYTSLVLNEEEKQLF